MGLLFTILITRPLHRFLLDYQDRKAAGVPGWPRDANAIYILTVIGLFVIVFVGSLVLALLG